MPVRNLTLILLAAVASLLCYGKAQKNREAARVAAAMELVESYYIDEVDRRTLYEGAMNGMLGALDPYSSYIAPEDFTQFQESLDQEFGGIGIVVEINPETNRLTVMTPLVGTPAHRAGIMAGDEIVAIDGNDTLDMDMKSAVNLMRGKPGQEVKVKIERPGTEDPIEMALVREIIPVESVLGEARRTDGTWSYLLPGEPRIAYLRLTTFGEHSVQELTKALGEIDGQADGFILDLRNNAGGLLSAAVETCDMFLERGSIVTTRGRGDVTVEEFEAKPGVLLDPKVPMVILVNGYSASASEIVAACLQDHRRAVIVGQRSFGKGTVQNVIQMENGAAALKLTTAGYWRPSGRNIHRRKNADESAEWGVKPNPGLEVVLTDEQLQKLVMARRARDIIAAPNGAEEKPVDVPVKPADESADGPAGEPASVVEEPPAPEVAEDESAEPQSIDPQLDRAIEHLREQIENPARAAEKA